LLWLRWAFGHLHSSTLLGVGPQLTPHALPARVKPGKSRQIVANEAPDPRTLETGKTNGPLVFSGDATRFLEGGEGALALNSTSKPPAGYVTSAVVRIGGGAIAPM
jgi:hypothetical protein